MATSFIIIIFKVFQFFFLLNLLLCLFMFCRTQGSCTAFIRPEYLLPPELYDVYVQMRETALSPNTTNDQRENELSQDRVKPLHLSQEVFEIVSKKTWVDVLMQILKVIKLNSN